jgi:hypothetical protein
MKALFVTLFTMLMATSLMAHTITTKANGDWDQNSTWTPSGTPSDNDTIAIPFGFTVTVPANFVLNNVVIIVSGTLDLQNGKLKLDNSSKVIINSGATMTGSGSNDQLTIGGTFKFQGPGTVNGYAYADNTTGSGFLTGTLAVQFKSFFVTRKGANNQLSWSTSSEVNNAWYAIEKSTDTRTWNQIAVITGAGTTDAVSNYGYTDKNSTDADVYYRIREVAANGANVYSAIRSLHTGSNTITNIFTSSNKTITIDFNSDVKDNVSIQLINMSGQVIVRKEFSQASYRLIVNAMSAGSGVYAVRVSDSKGWSEVKKIAL